MRQFIIWRSISESSYLLSRYDDGDVNIKWTLAGLRESRKNAQLSSCPSLIAKQNVEISHTFRVDGYISKKIKPTNYFVGVRIMLPHDQHALRCISK